MKDFFLADAPKHRGRNVRSQFLVAQKQLRDRNDGNGKYLSLTLCDRTGRIDGRLWDNAETWAARFEQNDFVDVQALWTELRDKVGSFTDPDLKRLVFAFLDDPEIARRYKQAPAAKFMHHA